MTIEKTWKLHKIIVGNFFKYILINMPIVYIKTRVKFIILSSYRANLTKLPIFKVKLMRPSYNTNYGTRTF